VAQTTPSLKPLIKIIIPSLKNCVCDTLEATTNRGLGVCDNLSLLVRVAPRENPCARGAQDNISIRHVLAFKLRRAIPSVAQSYDHDE
jgi:hypothetical protein